MSGALFAPGPHSRPVPEWEPAAPAEAERVREVLAEGWGLWLRNRVRCARWGTPNSRNYRVGRVVAKQLLALGGAGRYLAALEAALALPPLARSLLPEHLPTLRGERCLVDLDGEAWVVMRLAEGRSFGGERRALEPVAWAVGALGAALALLERPPRRLERREPLTDEDVRVLWGLREDLSLTAHLEEVLAARGRLRALPLRPAHIDLHPHNVLVDAIGGVTMTDLESIRLAPAVLALGYACFALVRQAVVRGMEPQEAAKEFLAAAALGPWLDGAEDLLWTGTKAELLKRLAWIEAERWQGRTKWLEAAPRHRAGLAEIEAMKLW